MFEKFNKFLLFCIPFILSCTVSAQSSSTSEVQIRGFGTLGITGSDSELVGFRRSLSTPEGVFKSDNDILNDSLFGFQLDASLIDSLDIGLQLVIKDRVEDNLDKSLKLAFLGYHLNSQTTIRVGRMGLDLYLLSDHRDVGFAYLWARPVTEFYGNLALQVVDGIDILYTHRAGQGILELHGFFGETSGTVVLNRDDIDAVEVVLNPTYGLSIGYESGPWRWQLAFATSTIDRNFDFAQPLIESLGQVPFSLWPQATQYIEELNVKGSSVDYNSVGLVYDQNEWVIQSEISYLNADKHLYTRVLSAYVSAGYRVGRWTPYLVLSQTQSVIDPFQPSAPVPSLEPLDNASLELLNSGMIDQNTVSFGTRWDMQTKLSLKFQIDRREFEGGDAALWQTGTQIPDSATINTWSITLDYVF